MVKHDIQAGASLLDWSEPSIDGTSLRGYYESPWSFEETVARLITASGQPARSFDQYKTSVEFRGTFHGHVFTLYDYKEGRTIHIGGADDLDRVGFVKALTAALMLVTPTPYTAAEYYSDKIGHSWGIVPIVHTLQADDDVIIDLRIPVKRQLLRDLLCTAVEGGTNYWAEITQVERTPDGDYLSATFQEHESVTDAVAPRSALVTAEALTVGLQRLSTANLHTFPASRKHLTDALTESGDTITADVVVQMTMFGELVYG